LDIGIKVWSIGKLFWIFFLLLVTGAGLGLIYQQKRSTKVELLEKTLDEEDDVSSMKRKVTTISEFTS
jgi:hypothetical protein